MKILPITINKFYNVNVPEKKVNNSYTSSVQFMPAISVPFLSAHSESAPLRKLAEYGIPCMYTGKLMIGSKTIAKMLSNNVFDFDLDRLVRILRKYEDRMLPVTHDLFLLLKKHAAINPKAKIDEVLQVEYNTHQKKLLELQQPIFEELMLNACEMPKKQYNEYLKLISITNKRLLKDPVVLPFSKKEFIYKLQRASVEIKSKNNQKEVRAINNLIREAKKLFLTQEDINIYGRGMPVRKKRYEYQMQQEVLSENLQKFNTLKQMLENSALNRNKDLIRIFNATSAKICGIPFVAPFKRKEFIHELEKITNTLENENLAANMIRIAHKLPTSTENLSAYIAKYVNDERGRIGYFMLQPSECTVERIIPESRGGKSKLFNYGLCSSFINKKRTNYSFAEWLRRHPEAYINCQKYVDRLIELYLDGTFDKVGLKKKYIIDFAETVANASPNEKPLLLNLSALNN